METNSCSGQSSAPVPLRGQFQFVISDIKRNRRVRWK